MPINEILKLFEPLKYEEIVNENDPRFLQSVAAITDFHTEENLPTVESAELIILGCPEYRLSGNTNTNATIHVRKSIYNKIITSAILNIADLGDLILPQDPEETIPILTNILTKLYKLNKHIIILGGSQYLTLAQTEAYNTLKTYFNYALIDSQTDLLPSNAPVNEYNYNAHILMRQEENFMHHFAIVGTQRYLISNAEKELFEELNYEMLPLGEIKQDIFSAEPLFREANVISMDASALKAHYAPATTNPNPAGLSIEELAQLMRFAGHGLRKSSLGIYNYQNDKITLESIAIATWYFIEGLISNLNDLPNADRSNMQETIILLQDQDIDQIKFFRHKLSGRLWMEIPILVENKIYSKLIPASEKDLYVARKNRIPERWWLFYNKFLF